MRIPRWLDRTWTWAVGLSFALMIPIWLIEWSHDFGVINVALAISAVFLFGMWRAWPTD